MIIPNQHRNTMIEHARDLGLVAEFDAFNNEIEKLSREQLWQILQLVGISFGTRTDIEHHDLVYVMRETSWEDFFTAYRKVLGHSFPLDSLTQP